MKLLLFALTGLLLVGCNNNTGSTENKDDTVQATGVENKEITGFQNSFPQLFSYFKKEAPAFDPANFYEAGEGKISKAAPQPIDEQNLLPYKKLFIYNNDSTQAIDLYSYNYIITSNTGVNELQSAEPDTEIGLINFKNKTRKRIFFAGPSYNIWDAAWLTKNAMVLAGAEVIEAQKIIPIFLQINMADSTIKTFQCSDTLSIDMKEYVTNKIKKQL